jgi:hypothetical protein
MLIRFNQNTILLLRFAKSNINYMDNFHIVLLNNILMHEFFGKFIYGKKKHRLTDLGELK